MTYQELLTTFIRIKVEKTAKEVIFKTVSCMCDNVSYLRFRKDENGEFKLRGMYGSGSGAAYSNWQIPYPKHELEWMADEGRWTKIKSMIEEGTSRVENAKSR